MEGVGIEAWNISKSVTFDFFLATQAWRDASIRVQFDLQEHTIALLFHTQFPDNQWRGGWVHEPQIFQIRSHLRFLTQQRRREAAVYREERTTDALLRP